MNWRQLSFALGLGLAACGGPVVPIDPSSNSLLEFDLGGSGSSYTFLFVLVADDADTPDAQALRTKVAGMLRDALYLYVWRQGACEADDPAEWWGGEVRVLLARPSAPEGEVLHGPVEDPALFWTSHLFTLDEADAVADAVALALEERLAQPGEAYRPLFTAKSTIELVTGVRAPSGGEESALVASLGALENVFHELLVASTRDDESTSQVAALVPEPEALERVFVKGIIAPLANADPGCGTNDPGSSRIEQWADLQDSFEVQSWPCDSMFASNLLHPGSGPSCAAPCFSKAVEVDPASGVASCLVTVDQFDLVACDAALGRRDPASGPTLVSQNGVDYRRCEVVQLAGAALESCRHDLSCAACEPGFCATEVLELLFEEYCGPGESAFPLRYVGGARTSGTGWLHVACSTVDP